MVLAFLAGYALCRVLWCNRLPSLLGAGAWALSGAVALDSGGPISSGSLVLPFAVAGAFSRGRGRWGFLLFAFGALALPHSQLAALVGALSVAVLAALGAQRLWDGEGGPAFLFGAAVSAVLALWRAPGLGALVAMMPLAVGAGLTLAMSRETRARAGVAALVLLFAAERALDIGGALPVEAARLAFPAARP